MLKEVMKNHFSCPLAHHYGAPFIINICRYINDAAGVEAAFRPVQPAIAMINNIIATMTGTAVIAGANHFTIPLHGSVPRTACLNETEWMFMYS